VNKALRQLVLIPATSGWIAPSQPVFVQQLGKLGLLGQALATHAQCFLIGENFLQQFSFMGCAPSLNLAPADVTAWRLDEFVFVHVHSEAGAPRWYADSVLGKPACPLCHKRDAGWHAQFSAAQGMLRCVHCQQASPVCDWQWFDAGGCARQFISIVNVYPKESIPTDALLQELAELTGVQWTYFYLHAPLLGA